MAGWQTETLGITDNAQIKTGPGILHSITAKVWTLVGTVSIYDGIGANNKICDLKFQAYDLTNKDILTKQLELNWEFQTGLYITTNNMGGIIVTWS